MDRYNSQASRIRLTLGIAITDVTDAATLSAQKRHVINRVIALARKHHLFNVARSLLGGACAHCGSLIQLEFAHVKPTGLSGPSRGSFTRLQDVREHLDSYILLCRVCHLEYDRRDEPQLDFDDVEA